MKDIAKDAAGKALVDGSKTIEVCQAYLLMVCPFALLIYFYQFLFQVGLSWHTQKEVG